MSEGEATAFLADERVVTCATVGPRGWPHLMPLWYVLRASEDRPAPAPGELGRRVPAGGSGPRLWAWTYGVSRKVRNIERDPRVTLQVEAGEQYQELRGVMLECEVAVHRDLEVVKALGHEIFARYASPRGQPPAEDLPAAVGQMVDKQAAKRVALEFVELRRASWDHRKLGGIY
ncbi:MAG: pyridoxamine 5'-phosphate oxidase family protein [Solirubrobacteraceae bacterium]|jgi:hypothetical protein